MTGYTWANQVERVNLASTGVNEYILCKAAKKWQPLLLNETTSDAGTSPLLGRTFRTFSG